MKKNKLLISALLAFSVLSSCGGNKNSLITWNSGTASPTVAMTGAEGDYYYDIDDGIIYKYSENTWVKDVVLGGGNGNTNKTAYELYKTIFQDYTKTEEEWTKDLVDGRLLDAKTFTVSYNPDNGQESFSHTITENKKAFEPENPTKENYEFLGWYNQYD